MDQSYDFTVVELRGTALVTVVVSEPKHGVVKKGLVPPGACIAVSEEVHAWAIVLADVLTSESHQVFVRLEGHLKVLIQVSIFGEYNWGLQGCILVQEVGLNQLGVEGASQ